MRLVRLAPAIVQLAMAQVPVTALLVSRDTNFISISVFFRVQLGHLQIPVEPVKLVRLDVPYVPHETPVTVVYRTWFTMLTAMARPVLPLATLPL